MAVKLSIVTKEEDKSVVPYTLKFINVDEGVEVVAENAHDTWSLVKFKSDGSIYLFEYIGEDSGFKLTKDGKLSISKEEN